MINKTLAAIAIWLLAACLWGGAARAEIRELPSITVLAPISLTEPLSEIARVYAREKDAIVTTQYDSIAELTIKVVEGAPADLFIASDPKWIAQLKLQGLIDIYSQSNLLSTSLVLIAKKDGQSLPKPFATQEEAKAYFARLPETGRLQLGDPKGSSVGRYAKDALQKLGWWKKTEARHSYSLNSRLVVAKVLETGFPGITYYSEALNNPGVEVLYVFEGNVKPDIIYQAAVVAGENMEGARGFLAYLKSEAASSAFAKYGFTVR